MNSSLSTRGKFLIFTLCISLIPIAIITTIYFLNARSTLKYQILEQLRAVAESKRLHMLSLMERIKTQTIDFSSDEFIRNCMRRALRGGSFYHDEAIRLNKYFSENKQLLNQHFIAIILVDKYGKVISSTNLNFIDKDMSNNDIFTQGISKSEGKTHIKLHYLSSLNTNCILISTPIISQHNAGLLGVIINVYNLRFLNEITTDRVGMGETGEVYLVNRDKVMLTESRFIEDASLKQKVDTEPIRAFAENNEEIVGIYKDYRGIPVIGASMIIPGYNWVLLAEIDEAEAFAPVRILGIVTLIFGVVVAALVTGAGVIFTISVSGPIKDLKDAVERFADGDLNYPEKIRCKGDIGLLARNFHTIAERLLKEIVERKRVEEMLQHTDIELRQVLSSISDYIWSAEVDKKGTFTYRYYSPVVEKITGRPPEFYVRGPEHWLGTLHPEDRTRLENALIRISVGKSALEEEEYRIIKPDGTIRWVRDSIVAKKGENESIHLHGVVSDITEYKRAEESLRKSKAGFANAQRIAHLGNWEWDIREDKLYWSDELYRIFGLSPDTFTPTYRVFLSFVHGDDRESVKKSLRESICKRKPYTNNLRIILPNGRIRIIHVQTEIISNQRGKVVKMNGTVQDITEFKRIEDELRVLNESLEQRVAERTTELMKVNEELRKEIAERRQAEEALRTNESKYRLLLENLPQKIFYKDKNSVYVSCNQNYAADLSIKSDEIRGKMDYDFYPRAIAEKYRADDKRIMKSGRTEEIEENYIKDGRECIVHTVKTPVKDEKGAVVGILGIFWDKK
ncbi:MAG: PAS domain-containing protein [Candidatus Jettenia caeni]|nr:PAS domain-containing protein [Candidatus Jettenia caeni]